MAIQKNKLWLKGFCPERSDEEIRQFCDRYGKTIHMARPRARDYVFLTYSNDDDALEAQANFIRDRMFCNFATRRTNPIDSSVDSSPPAVDRQQSQSPPSPTSPSSPNKEKKRVHFPANVVTQQVSSKPSNQQSKQAGDNTPNLKVLSIKPSKTVFRNGEKIIITHVQSVNSFYAHPVAKDKERHEFIEQLSKEAKTIECVKCLGKLRMGLVPYNRGYYRAILKGEPNSLNDTVLVTLVDVGLSLAIPFDKIKPVPEQYTKIRITTRFTLDGTNDDSNQSYGARCLESYIGTELKMKCDGEFAERQSTVQLINPNTRENINNLLKQMQRTFDNDELIRNPATIGNNQTLITLDDSKLADGFNLITFIQSNDLPTFNQQSKQIQAVGNEVNIYPPYEPKEDDLCLVMYAGSWHRALFAEQTTPCAEDGNDVVCALLIDLWKGVSINSKAIRNITVDLVRMPIVSFVGEIKGYGEKIDKNADFIHKFKKMNTIRLKSVGEKSDRGFYQIEI